MSLPSLALLGLALAQDPRAAAPLVISPTVAQMVVVDTYVTDRKGRPIRNLRAEDFELLEDGKRVVIAAFFPPDAPGPAEDARSVGAAPSQNTSPLADREAITLVLYVDRWLLSPRGRKQALDQALTLAESHLARGARVLVIADDKGLRPLTPVTTDLDVVRAAIARIQGWATASPGARESRDTLENVKSVIEGNAMTGCDCVCSMPQLMQLVRIYSTGRAIEAREASDRLTFLVNSLLGVSGRKTLIYVSEGLEQRPGIQLYEQLENICPAALSSGSSSIWAAMQEFETSEPLREVVARANASRVTLYPLDAQGLTTNSSADISQPDRRYVPTARNDMVRRANLSAPLHLLAEETGGFAMLNGLDPRAAMKRFAADEEGHYIIGFVPGEADGQTHRLGVRLTNKAESKHHADLRHRQAYLRAELPARRGQRSLATLLFGLEENNLNAQASVERTSPSSARVRISLPSNTLSRWPNTEGRGARAQVVISLRPARGEGSPVTVRENEVTFTLDRGTSAREGDRREVIIEVAVGEGEYEFAIGIENAATGSSAYLRRLLGPGWEPRSP